jgi:hypothetical protein
MPSVRHPHAPPLLNRLNVRSPVTIRGLGLASVAAYFLGGPPAAAFDIVARYLGFGASLLLTYCVVGGFLSRARFSRTATVSLDSLPTSDGYFVSGRSISLIASARLGARLPFFRLRITPLWPEARISHPVAELSSAWGGLFSAPFPVILPHRGEWSVTKLRVTCSDILGLTSIRWECPLALPLRLTIYPPPSLEQELPIVSTRRSSGEVTPSDSPAEGELFDLKRYDPSDGIRRIVWKIFARTGELVARHPEHHSQPEGKTVAFIIAEKNEDRVAAAGCRYLVRSVSLGMEVRCGCLGMTTGRHLARNIPDIERLILESTWDAIDRQLIPDLQHFISELTEDSSNGETYQVALFISSRRLLDSSRADLLSVVSELLGSHGLEPVWYITPEALAEPAATLTSRSERTPLPRKLGVWWFLKPNPNMEDTTDPQEMLHSVKVRASGLGGRIVICGSL